MIPNVGQNGKLGQISIFFMYIDSYFIPILYIYMKNMDLNIVNSVYILLKLYRSASVI